MTTTIKPSNQKKLPQGPKSPSLFQLINWIARPFKYLEECFEQYGDIFTIRLFGFQPLVFVANPEGIQEIFNADAKYFDVGRTNDTLRPFFGDNSLLTMDGATHKKERKLLMPPFHGEKVKLYAESICQITDKVAKKWKINEPFIARSATQEITLEVIMQTVFGLSEDRRYQEIKPVLAGWLDLTGSPLRASFIFFKFLQVDLGAWSPWGKFIRQRNRIYEFLQNEIERKRANKASLGNDILSLMLCTTDEDGHPMSDAEIKDELITLLIAGHETTASALAWAFYWLETTPEVKSKLLEEIDSLGVNPDPLAFSKLPYLTAFCQETLRLYPIAMVAFSRIAKENIKIMGHEFCADTTFIPSIYSIHHREDLYPNSFDFRPERFLEKQYSPYEFFPFGGGVRLCLGYALAILEMKLVIATIVSKYNLKLANSQPIKPMRRGATMTPSNGVPLIMTGTRSC